jgi:glycosyltransferase involved in cell wall biosynthesis
MCQQVIAPSQSVKDILLKRRVKAPIAVIPTGINVEAFGKGSGFSFRQENRIPAHAMVIGHVSRLAPEKNLDFMIPALIKLLNKDKRVHALIVGRGPSVPMIREKFKSANLQKRLHMPGYLDGQRLIDAYHAMDVFAFASLSETQGIVLTEALAAGVPVVAIDSPGVREVVKNNVDGRLVGKPDQKGFIRALEWVLNQPAERLKIIKKHARKSAARYSLGHCTLRMLKVYKRLVSKKIPHSAWHNFEDRVKADWDIIRNLVKASEAGIFNRN